MEGGGNQQRWLLTYADLITLLMVFFVVMFAISQADREKFGLLKSSIQRAFGVAEVQQQSTTILPGGGTGLLEAPQPSITGDEATSGETPIFSSPPSQAAGEGGTMEEIRQAVLPLATSLGVADSVRVYSTPEGTVVSLSGNLLFESGKAELQPEGVGFLHVLAEVLRRWPNRLRVEGHTDNVAINTPLYPSNWELSSARAIVATRYLVEEEKLPAPRVAAAAYGDSRPVADNGTREGRMRNRRVDIVIRNE